jgi:hypothetical protein
MELETWNGPSVEALVFIHMVVVIERISIKEWVLVSQIQASNFIES